MAQTRFDANNLTYEILSESEKTVEVHDGSKSNGEVFIPSTISYNGNNYTVTVIGEEAFSWCSELTAVTIPNSVIYISKKAFSGCYGLTSITIPNSVTSIGNYAFGYCSKLTSITIPNSVTSIGDMAFRFCTELTSATIPNAVTNIGRYAFSNCSKLTTITIPNSITSINVHAFSECPGITSLTIPNSVTTISNSAFYNCSGLISVTIPETVTTIGEWAFSQCTGLQYFINFAKEPQLISSSVFDYVDLTNVQLSVPSSSVDKYRNADIWKDFGRIEGQDAGINAMVTDNIMVNGGVLHNPAGEEILIYDLNGRKIYSGNDYELRIPKGLYILQTPNGNRKVVF